MSHENDDAKRTAMNADDVESGRNRLVNAVLALDALLEPLADRREPLTIDEVRAAAFRAESPSLVELVNAIAYDARKRSIVRSVLAEGTERAFNVERFILESASPREKRKWPSSASSLPPRNTNTFDDDDDDDDDAGLARSLDAAAHIVTTNNDMTLRDAERRALVSTLRMLDVALERAMQAGRASAPWPDVVVDVARDAAELYDAPNILGVAEALVHSAMARALMRSALHEASVRARHVEWALVEAERAARKRRRTDASVRSIATTMRATDIANAGARPIVRALLVLEQAVNKLEFDADELGTNASAELDVAALEDTLREFSEKNADAAYFLRDDVNLDAVLDTLYGDDYDWQDVALPDAERALYALAHHRSWRLADPSRLFIKYVRREGLSIDVLTWFVERGANIRAHEDVALQTAAHNGQLAVVKWLVERDADIHAGGDFAVRFAAESGHLDVVKFLVERGANIHARTDYAVRWAADNGHLAVVKFLVERGADIRADNDIAVRVAAENGHLDVAKFLVERGADIHPSSSFVARRAAANGHLNVVQWLVESVTDNRVSIDNLLQVAASNGRLDVVRWLVERGANINAIVYAKPNVLEWLDARAKRQRTRSTIVTNVDASLEGVDDKTATIMFLENVLEHNKADGTNLAVVDQILSAFAEGDNQFVDEVRRWPRWKLSLASALRALVAPSPFYVRDEFHAPRVEQYLLALIARYYNNSIREVLGSNVDVVQTLFYDAIRNDQRTLAMHFIDDYGSVIVDVFLDLPAAARRDNIEMVERLLREEYATQTRNFGAILDSLEQAVERKSIRVVRYLLEHFAFDNVTSFFASAVAHGHLEIVRALFERPATIRFLERKVLTSAIIDGPHQDVINFLLTRAAQYLDTVDMYRAIEEAIDRSYADIARSIYAAYVTRIGRPISDDDKKRAFLNIAFRNNDVATARWLVEEFGVDFYAQQSGGWPIATAIMDDSADIARWLVDEHGVDETRFVSKFNNSRIQRWLDERESNDAKRQRTRSTIATNVDASLERVDDKTAAIMFLENVLERNELDGSNIDAVDRVLAEAPPANPFVDEVRRWPLWPVSLAAATRALAAPSLRADDAFAAPRVERYIVALLRRAPALRAVLGDDTTIVRSIFTAAIGNDQRALSMTLFDAYRENIVDMRTHAPALARTNNAALLEHIVNTMYGRFDSDAIKESYRAAARANSLDVMRFLVQKFPIDLSPYVTEAIRSDNFEMVRTLLSPISLDRVSFFGTRFLYTAAQLYNDSIAMLLLDVALDRFSDEELFDAFDMSMQRKRLALARRLFVEVQRGDYRPSPRSLWNALNSAAVLGEVSFVRWLVERRGVDIHADNDYILTLSTFNDHVDVVRWLVDERGFDAARILAMPNVGPNVRRMLEERASATAKRQRTNVDASLERIDVTTATVMALESLMEHANVDGSSADRVASLLASATSNEFAAEARRWTRSRVRLATVVRALAARPRRPTLDFVATPRVERWIAALVGALSEPLFGATHRDEARTVVESALASRQSDLAAALIDSERSLDVSGLLELAARAGDRRVVTLLLGDSRVDASENQSAALYEAVVARCLDVVRALLADGRIDPSAFRNAALRYALDAELVDVARTLWSDARVSSSAAPELVLYYHTLIDA